MSHGLPDGRGLDLGCGDGLLTRIVLEKVGSRTLVGIDPDPAEAAQARELGIYAAVHVAPGDQVPEPDGSFDWVLSNSVLEHIPAIEPVLAEVARLLRNGGVFILTVPGPGFHDALRGPLLPGASRSDYLRHLDHRLAHHRYWGPDDWRRELAPHGLRVVGATGYMDRRQVERWESISRFTAGVLYGLSARRRQPIEIQRGLGLRKQGRRMPGLVARRLASILAAGIDGDTPAADQDSACCLIEAVRG